MPVNTHGFDTLGYDLQKLLDMSPKAIKKALEAGAQPILSKIQANAPQGPTGRLKDAIKAGKVQKRGGSYFIKLGVIDGKTAPHAHLVEHGHGGPHPAPPHPFLRPAFDEAKDEGYALMRDTLADEMRG